jgi:hypothetical protein
MKAKNNIQEELIQRLTDISTNGILDAENANRSENMHRLFMYPAMMVPATQSAILGVFADIFTREAYAIDPFMGSGTSLMSCMEYGFNVFGQDINPFAVLLSKAKTTIYDITRLKRCFSRIKESLENDKSTTVEVSFPSIDKWFSKDAQISFSKIRRAILNETQSNYRYFFWVLMAEAIRVGSNDRTSTFKLHQRSVEELERRKINIISKFLSIAECGISDYELFYDKLQKKLNILLSDSKVQAEIVWGNSQCQINTKQKFDLLLSSPPYGDNHTTVTYGQTSYLPLQWIPSEDINCPYDYLRSTQEIDCQSLGGRINNDSLVEKLDILLKKSKHFRTFYCAIPDDEKTKYRKTISFIADFDESLQNIVQVMKDDAYYIWTIGNRFVGKREIPNAEILQDLMEYYGLALFFKAERQILNKIQPKKNNYSRTMEKEKIMIFHRN